MSHSVTGVSRQPPRATPDRPLPLKSLLYRRRLLEIIKHAGAGHTGGGLSCIDILNVLYNSVLSVTPETLRDPHRDRYVQSKGHCVEALYVVLADRGFFPAIGARDAVSLSISFVGHPTRKVPGVEHEHRRPRSRPLRVRRNGDGGEARS